MVRNNLNQWLVSSRPTGWQALVFGIVALALPTLVRAAVNGMVSGCEFTPYLPSVLLCAILLSWWQAGAVAVGSVALLGLLFDGSPEQFLRSQCFQSSAGMFLLSSAAMIGTAAVVRNTIEALQRRGAGDPSDGIIFSLEKGEVWASWYGNALPVRLGSQPNVAGMMQDFLEQDALAKHLAGKNAGSLRRVHEGDARIGHQEPYEAPQQWLEHRATTLMNLRRARLSVFGTTLFSDPAWDILLELYTLKLTGRGAPITGLAHIASPLTLARWLQILEDKGLIFSWDDRSTAGQPGVCLSATGATNMFAVLTELV